MAGWRRLLFGAENRRVSWLPSGRGATSGARLKPRFVLQLSASVQRRDVGRVFADDDFQPAHSQAAQRARVSLTLLSVGRMLPEALRSQGAVTDGPQPRCGWGSFLSDE